MKINTRNIFLFVVYDASSKFPTGIIAGKSFDFGNFDECLDTVTGDLEFKPQYCIVNIRFFHVEKPFQNYNSTRSKSNASDSVWEAIKVSHKYVCMYC